MKEQSKKVINWALPYLAIAVMAYIIMYPQIISHGVILGTDSIFHFNRFYDAAKQIQQGNWSYFQSNYSFQQSGRIINAVYGPLFAYLNGILLGILGTWFRYQVISSFLVYFIGGVGMYQLATKVHACRRIALLVSLIFLCIGWLPRWELAQNMNAWGAALAPYMIMVGITMITDHDRPVHWLSLMTLMTVIIQIHLLSSIFFTLTLVPFFIIGLILSTKRGQMLWETAKAVIGTVILTGNVWGALLMLNLHNHIAQPAPFNMQINALTPSQFTSTREYLIYFCWILFALQLVYVIFTFKRSLVNDTVTIMGAIILLISSTWFPWESIQKAAPILQTTLQFPNRLTVIAYPLLLVGIAMSCQQLIDAAPHDRLRLRLVSGLLLFTLFQVVIPTTTSVFRRTAIYESDEVLNTSTALAWVTNNSKSLRRSVHTDYPGQLLMKVEKRAPDYLPIPKKYLNRTYVRSYAYQDQVIRHAKDFKHTVLPKGRLCLSWNAKRSGKVRLPIITYQESRLTVNGHRLRHFQRSRVGAPYVYQQRGHNTAILSFHQSTWFTVLLAVSLIGLTILLAYGLYQGLIFISSLFKTSIRA
ncbi:glycosyltransferase family protein [Limosilactobacillus avium]|uniref:cell division protein n=1 Tax=Limosilactobacillus avium TaxID=2991831 RepID=UPI0024BBC39F|nr:cell division protein [Limosilactobacillus avium]